MMGSRMKTTLASEDALPDSVSVAQPVDVSVVIPCLNEANSLAHCVDKAMGAFRKAGLFGEVVVADNGSTDGSVELAEGRGAPLHARLTPVGGQRNQTRYLVVVARAATELYTSLTRTFADSDSIEVIRDRRFSERRQRDDSVGLDRRRGDRRSRLHAEGQIRWCEWSRVPIAGVPATLSAHQS